jgi:S-DNA-T family DNA segregation ATPase FtsK/SpoIIIE
LDDEDPLYEEAKKLVMGYRNASASLIQRKLSVGYARAARLLDKLEKSGVVGEADGANPRKVLVDK